MLNPTKPSPLLALFHAMTAMASTGLFHAPTPRKPRRHVLRMVTGTPAEFAAHNRAVATRQVKRRAKLVAGRTGRRQFVKTLGIRQFKRIGIQRVEG